MLKRVGMAVAIGSTLALVGCQTRDRRADQVHAIEGVVVAVDPVESTIQLDHEAIPGVMEAMQMEYSVSDPAILAGLEAGDSVSGRFQAGRGRWIVTSLTRR